MSILFSERKEYKQDEQKLECIELVPITRRNSMLTRYRVTNRVFLQMRSLVESTLSLKRKMWYEIIIACSTIFVFRGFNQK